MTASLFSRLLNSIRGNTPRLRRLAQGLLHNERLHQTNLARLQAQPKNDKRFLFVADGFSCYGGAETRIADQMEYLASKGYDCWLFTQYNDNERLLRFPNLFLPRFFATSFERQLIEIIRTGQFDNVEFIVKSYRYFRKTNIERVKAHARTGVSVLNTTRMPERLLQSFDYLISFYQFKSAKETLIRNWISTPIPDEAKRWHYCGQKRALYIARLHPGKMPELKNFLDVCERYGIAFDIMGPIDKAHRPEVQAQLKRIPRESLLKPTNAVPFLSTHSDRYLFVGGEGLVALEASALGFPVMVTSQQDDGRSCMITRDNFDLLYRYNFVIRTIPNDPTLIGADIDAFIRAASDGVSDLYRIDPTQFDSQTLSEAMKIYLRAVENSTKTCCFLGNSNEV